MELEQTRETPQYLVYEASEDAIIATVYINKDYPRPSKVEVNVSN